VCDSVIGVIYGTQSLRVIVGPVEQEAASDDTDRKDKTGCVLSLNDLVARYRKCLDNFRIKGYISLSEENGHWGDFIKYTPINVHDSDLLTLKSSSGQGFDENILIQH